MADDAAPVTGDDLSAQLSAEEYLMAKGVPTLIDEAVQALLNERPPDALSFFAQHFARRSGPGSQPAVDPADVKLCRPATQSTFYLSRQAALLSPAERELSLDGLDDSIRKASVFSSFANIRPGSPTVHNSAALHRRKMIPHLKRLATCFLSQLGREPCASATTATNRGDGPPDTVYHVPAIRLPTALRDRSDLSTNLCISAQEVDQTQARHEAAGCRDEVWEDICEKSPMPTAEQIYGDGRFQINIGELKRLEASTRLATGPGLPPRFVTELCSRTTNPDVIWFFSLCRSLPLSELGKETRWEWLEKMYQEKKSIETATVDGMEKAREEVMGKIKRGDDVGKPPDDELGGRDWDIHQRRLWRDNASTHLAYLNRRDEMKRISEEFAAWLHSATSTEAAASDYGFASQAQAQGIITQSLTELCTSVCVSQLGYFFVDGSDGAANQIADRPPQAIVFLSAAGLDFNTPTTSVVESVKYFTRPDDLPPGTPAYEGFRGFLPGGEEALLQRVKELYRVIFASCKHHGARNPSVLPMGLGVFLKNVHADDQDTVKSCYFRAQYQLLCEEDWGFECYWINPAQHGALARRELEAGLEPNGDYNAPQRGRFLRCHIAFHNRDAKFIATELAKRARSPAVLNPSDCAAVMLGLMGYYWESGRTTYYVGEEDFAATGTGLLAHGALSTFLTEQHRIIHCRGPVAHPQY